MSKLPFNDENIAIINRYSDECLNRGYSTDKIDQTKIGITVEALYAILGLSAPKVVFVDGPMAAINKAVEIGDTRSKQDIRYDLFVANWRGYWLRRYGAGLELDPDIFPDKDREELEHWLALADEGHAYLCYEECVIVSERPEIVSVDSTGRLHHESHAALRERDGVEIYAWHGVEVPPEVVTTPESITVDQINSEENAELRRILIERYGQAEYLIDSKAVEIHRDIDWHGRERVLYEKEIPGDEPLVMVKVINCSEEPDGTRREFFLPVAPALNPLIEREDGTLELGDPQEPRTCLAAIASTWGYTADEYAPWMET